MMTHCRQGTAKRSQFFVGNYLATQPRLPPKPTEPAPISASTTPISHQPMKETGIQSVSGSSWR
jgi:hypothetical protein